MAVEMCCVITVCMYIVRSAFESCLCLHFTFNISGIFFQFWEFSVANVPQSMFYILVVYNSLIALITTSSLSGSTGNSVPLFTFILTLNTKGIDVKSA